MDAPRVGEALPRMDIAAFVGFAEAGPIDAPTPVEDVARFREIFGGDVPLAWDADRGEMRCGRLGRAVESFFRNGGRRCWVVRVAERSEATTHRFPLPGLFRVHKDRVEVAGAVARSPGGWADAYRIGTVSRTTRHRIDERAEPDENETTPFRVGSDGWSISVKTPEARFVAGDLLRVSFKDKPWTLFGFIDGIVARKTGARLRGADGFWFTAKERSGPPLPDPIPGASNMFSFYRLSDTDALGLSMERPGGSPGPAPRVHLQRFDILAWRGGTLQHRLTDLAFSGAHPRFWGRLPADAELFRRTAGRPFSNPSAERRRFLEQASHPRFPFAGPENAGDGSFYLPVEMSLAPDYESSSRAAPGFPESRLARDGLTHFRSKLFLDESLCWIHTGALQQEAEQKLYWSDPPVELRGIHALFPIDEVTLVAVPDAIHSRWSRDPSEPPEPLSAPWLEPAEEGETENRCALQWSSVAGATAYIVERDASPEFETPAVVHVRGEALVRVGKPPDLSPEPPTHFEGSMDAPRPAIYYFRVRAQRHGEVSAWSNTRAREIPADSFLPCGVTPPDFLALRLDATDPASPPGNRCFEWESADHRDDLSKLVDAYELQRAGDLEFRSARVIYKGTDAAITAPDEPDAIHYFRVRAWRGKTAGPWSNTVRVTPSLLGQAALQPLEEYTARDLLEVHRALIRMCAARGDLLAVLSAPRHFRQEEMLEYIAALTPGGAEPITRRVRGEDGNLNVPALTPGESRALSYAALYHPWPAARTTPGDGETSPPASFQPPDGPITGLIARQTLEKGAWFAPANEPLVDALALEPELNRDQWSELTRARVNVVRRTSRGFLAMNADTLSMDGELSPITTRRLLILLRRLALREGSHYVFEPNDEDFRDGVRRQFERFLSDMYARGAFAGSTAESAWRVVADASVNTPESVDRGRFIVELRVAPSRPLAFLKVRLVQSGPNRTRVQEV